VTEPAPAIARPPIPSASRRRWHFGRAVLDERTLELLVNGIDAELERKPLEVLIYLLQHAGEICTKDELLAGIWPGRILSETVLTKCIGRLRDVLGDDDQEIIKTAYGFGYRFVMPVRVEAIVVPEPARFDLRPGLHPPSRPLWSLVERLGTGGHGEAWRARHDKTNEQHVFKFALEEAALVALKREITLFRVINDTLGESARVVKFLDWNLEQIPYFVEAEYIAGGSLVDWVAVRGGVGGIPLSDRLEIVAKIAEALAAVHSVGVLHKDLKPSNVLVRPMAGNEIDIVLGDFGSGSVLDGNRLQELGITGLGFTKTVSSIDSASATPLYLAPEVLAGQPFTVKSDIYALGIILYQFLAGDFHKVMSPGWERGIDDELLREDIALMAEGSPGERLGDAGALARRLRTLGDRRRQLAATREALAKTDRAKRLLERARARRVGLVIAFAALLVGLTASTTLYIRERRAQERTEVAAAQSKAVTRYLSQYVFAPVSSDTESVQGMTVIELLRRAGDQIDRRFASQPEVASELHFVIGQSFQTFQEPSFAVTHFNRALELGEHLNGEGCRSAMLSASELIQVDYNIGQLRQHFDRYAAVLDAGQKRFDPSAPELLALRLNIAWGYYLLGDWTVSAQRLKALLDDIGIADHAHAELMGRAAFHYGQVLTDLARPREAREQFLIAIDQLTLSLSEKHGLVADARSALGRSLTDSGHFAEAKVELDRAHELALKWVPVASWTEVRPRFFTALWFLQQDQAAMAEPILIEIVRFEDDNEAAYLEANKDSAPDLDHTGPVRQALGETYARQGRVAESVKTLERAVAVFERANGPSHPQVISTRLSLAESLLADHRYEDAKVLLASIPPSSLESLPASHPILAQWDRVDGLIELSENHRVEARKSLLRAYEIYRTVYWPEHWRVLRAHQELLLATNVGAPQ
jgi:DNA-binding winged helix-turn-helix (wHTH) protein/tetratricopeptide (TPR) repeat protein